MSGRRAVAVAVVVLAAGLVAYLLASKASRPEPDAAGRTAAEAVVPPALAPTPSAPPDDSSAESNEAEEQEPEASPDAATERQEGFRVPVRLRYASGAPLVGMVEIRLAWKKDNDVFVDETFSTSSFEIVVPSPGVYEIFQLEIGGEDYAPLPPDVDLRPGSTIEWTLDEPRPAVLHVVDAGTRTPVTDARAYRYVWAPRSEHFVGFETPIQIPTGATLAGTPIPANRDGRVVLPPLWGTSKWYVIAPGRSWASVAAAHREEPNVVELSSGGSLRLEISRWSELASATVDGQWGTKGRARTPSRRTTLETPAGPIEFRAADDVETEGTWRLLPFPLPDALGHLEVDGLPVGPCGVGVRRGQWFEDGVLYGSGTVEIRAGETARLTIEPDLARVGRGQEVSGTIRVPAAWKLDRLGVFLRGDEPSTVGTELETWFDLDPETLPRFEWPHVPAGRYEVHAYPTGWRAPVDVPDEGRRLDLVLPEPCRGEVVVVDVDTGATVRSAYVHWTYVLPGSTGGWSEEAKLDDAKGTYEFVAPEGPVRVSASAAGYLGPEAGDDEASESIRMARAAPARATLRLRRGGDVVVRVRENGKPFPVEVTVCATQGDHDAVVSWGCVDGESRMSFEPGTWKIGIEDVTGFQSVTPKDVEVRKGETVEVTFDLERKR
jgi:hypothetical protein